MYRVYSRFGKNRSAPKGSAQAAADYTGVVQEQVNAKDTTCTMWKDLQQTLGGTRYGTMGVMTIVCNATNSFHAIKSPDDDDDGTRA